ncbi:hypothetical protein AB0O90_17215 [Microbacterium testaceum]|uniref:hypothetical protein n=1 Tax=Microbacterium testaceum TaxID=2033 RepID=UPI003425C523
MLTLTTPEGDTLTADTDVHLASQWLDKQHGEDWAEGLIPFDVHDAMNTALDDLALIRDGNLTGYTLTDDTDTDD